MATESPIGVFTDDLEVPAAINSAGRLVSPGSLDPEELYQMCKAGELQCPTKACEAPSLTYVAGPVRLHHYRHLSKGFGHDSESFAHLATKHAICNRARALGYLADVEQSFRNHVSDIFIDTSGGLSIEVQFSPETLARWREREEVRIDRHSGSQWIWGQPTSDEATTYLMRQKASRYLDRLPLVDLWFARLSADGEPQLAKARGARGWVCEVQEALDGVRPRVNLEFRWIPVTEAQIEPRGLVDPDYLAERENAVEAERARRAADKERELVERGQIERPNAISASGNAARGFRVGDQITHDKWADGTVLALNGSGDSTEIVIEFRTVGEKALLLPWAPIKHAVIKHKAESKVWTPTKPAGQVVISAKDQAKWAKLLHRADRTMRNELLDLYMRVRTGLDPVCPPASMIQRICACDRPQHDGHCPMFELDWPTGTTPGITKDD